MYEPVLGLAEEVGELCHAVLKFGQGIRGINEEEFERQARDAVGDIMIYLASFCNTVGFSMDRCLQNAWEEVSARDWIKYPDTGSPPTEQPETAQDSGGDLGYSE